MKKGFFIRMLSLFGCFAFVALISACGGQPPKQEMDAANTALQAAVSAGAEQFAPEAFKAMQDLMAKLKSEIEKKDYKAAKQTALLAKEAAVKAKEAADKAKEAMEAEKAKAKEAADALVVEITQGLEKAKGLVAEAEAAKLPADLMQPLIDQVAAAEAGIGELSGMIAEGKFSEFQAKADGIKGQLGQVEQGIAAAKAKADELKAAEKKPAKKK